MNKRFLIILVMVFWCNVGVADSINYNETLIRNSLILQYKSSDEKFKFTFNSNGTGLMVMESDGKSQKLPTRYNGFNKNGRTTVRFDGKTAFMIVELDLDFYSRTAVVHMYTSDGKIDEEDVFDIINPKKNQYVRGNTLTNQQSQALINQGLKMLQPPKTGCKCVCVNGRKQNLCATTTDIPQLCTGICPFAPLELKPITPPLGGLPGDPAGAMYCTMKQVQNAVTKIYSWQRVCR